MSNAIQSLAWRLPMPNASDKSVLAKLADNANDEGVCHPAWKRIERESSVSTATLSEILNAFECYGLVERTHRKRRGGANSSNSYQLNIPEFTKEEIASYWDGEDGVIKDFVEGYKILRKALTGAKNGKSVSLFLDRYNKAKEAQKTALFTSKWIRVMESEKKKKYPSAKAKSEGLKLAFKHHFSSQKVAHTSSSEVAHTSSSEVAHTSSSEVAHTSSSEVAHTSSSEVAHTSSSEVATIEPSYSFNHHISLTSKNKMSWIEIDPKRKELIRSEIKKIEESVLPLEDFENTLEMHGYKYVSFVAVYRQWLKSAKNRPTPKKQGNFKKKNNNVTDANKSVLDELFGKGGVNA